MHPLSKVAVTYTGYYTKQTLTSLGELDNMGNPLLTDDVKHPIELMLKTSKANITYPNLAGSNGINTIVECFILKPDLNVEDIPAEIFLDTGEKLVVLSKAQSLLKTINKVFGVRFLAAMS